MNGGHIRYRGDRQQRVYHLRDDQLADVMSRKERAFISHAHDSETHRSQALTLANTLRGDGVEAYLDQYYENDSID